jgi:hypothetical protein
MAADGEQGQRSLGLDGVETEPANPPQEPDVSVSIGLSSN